MVIMERHDQVNAALDQLIAAAAERVDEPVTVGVRRVGPESAATVLTVVRRAFEVRPPLDPPAAALSETVDTMAELLGKHGGLLATPRRGAGRGAGAGPGGQHDVPAAGSASSPSRAGTASRPC